MPIRSYRHHTYPGKEWIMTDASEGGGESGFGSWDVIDDNLPVLIDDFKHGLQAWIEWNLILNEEGGPSNISSSRNAPLFYNETLKEYLKQPSFYMFAHISKFVPEGSIRLNTTDIDVRSFSTSDIDSIAFLTPNNIISVIVCNPSDQG